MLYLLTAEPLVKVLVAVIVAAPAILSAGVLLAGHLISRSLKVQERMLKAAIAEREHAHRAMEFRLRAVEQGDSRRRSDMELQLQHNLRRREMIDSMLGAVALLEDGRSEATSAARTAGALFAMAKLNQLDIAIALLATLIPEDGISPYAAVWVIGEALISNEDDLPDHGMRLLAHHAAFFRSDTEELIWPSVLDKGCPSWLSSAAKDLLLCFVAVALARQSSQRWRQSTLAAVHNVAYSMRNDEDDSVAAGALKLLLLLQKAFTYDEIEIYGHGFVSIDKLRRETDSASRGEKSDAIISGAVLAAIRDLEQIWQR